MRQLLSPTGAFCLAKEFFVAYETGAVSKLSLNYGETGTPVVFCMSDSIPAAGEFITNNGTDPIANWHHGAVGEKQLLAGDSRMKALRLCSRQWVLTKDHWGAFHKLNLVPSLPENEDKSFTYVAMQRARFVGQYGLTFAASNGRPTAKNSPIDHSQRKALWASGQLSCDSQFMTANYLAERIILEGLQSMAHSSQQEEMYQANQAVNEIELLAQAATAVSRSTGFGQIYTEARKKAYMPPHMNHDPAGYLLSIILPSDKTICVQKDIATNTRSLLSAAVR